MSGILRSILWILHCSNGSVDPPTAASILQQLLCVSLLQLLALQPVMHYLLLCNILAEQVRNMLKGSCVLLMIAHTAAVQWLLLSSYYTLSSSINVLSNSFPSAVIWDSFSHKIFLMQILGKKKKKEKIISTEISFESISLNQSSWNRFLKKISFSPFFMNPFWTHLTITCHIMVLFFSLELRINFSPIHTWGRSMFKLAKELFKISTGLLLKCINLVPTFPTSFHHTFTGLFFLCPFIFKLLAIVRVVFLQGRMALWG